MTAMVARRDRSADSFILRTAARGAGLIGAAVVLGIILLQVIDDSGSPGGSTGQNTPATNGNKVTTTSQGTGRAPGEVLVQVFNGSGVNMAAQTTSNTLRAQGYKVGTPGDFPAGRTGTAVQCKPGFEDEAQALATKVGTGAVVEPYPTAPPTGTDPNANCLVILGK